MSKMIHLKVRSEYHFNSLIKCNELIKYCVEQNIKAVAIIDGHRLHGVVDFIGLSNAANIKPLVGIEIKLHDETATINLLAKNQLGLLHLMRLSSMAELSPISLSDIEASKEGLLLYVEGAQGLVTKECYQKDFKNAMIALTKLQKQFGKENVVVAMDRDNPCNKELVDISKRCGALFVFAQEACCIKKEDMVYQEVIEALHQKRKIGEIVKSRYLLEESEATEIFPFAVEAMENMQKIIEDFETLSIKKIVTPLEYPAEKIRTVNLNMLESTFTPINAEWKKRSDKEISIIGLLCQLAWKGFAKFYDKADVVAIQRLKYELGIIIDKGYSDYFLVIQDLIAFMEQDQIPYLPRGSVNSSLTSRCLEITKICPLQYKLFFERFLNPYRTDSPDIDLDVSAERRSEVIEYIRQRYGKERVTQIITFDQYGIPSAITAVSKMMSIPETEWKPLNEKYGDGKLPIDLQVITNERHKKMLEIAMRLVGYPKNISTHAAGIIISQDSLDQQLPMMENKTQIPNNRKQLEIMGLLKVDVLGNRNLDIVQATKALVLACKGIDLKELPLNDEKAMKLYREGDLLGVFQMDSYGMRQSSKMVKPEKMDDIFSLLALYRPGPMEFIKKYADLKAGIGSVVYLHDDLKIILEETYGIIFYQEQIMQIAAVLSDYSLGEADLLRRAITKKDKMLMEEQRLDFVNRAVKKGYDQMVAEETFLWIEKFADYGFPKSHAVAYGHLSYETAFLKANYPLEYMTVLISSALKTAKAPSYVLEAIRMGLPVIKPDINLSDIEFTTDGNSLVIALTLVKNVGQSFAGDIVMERKKGEFSSFLQFCRRVPSSISEKQAMECLISSGVFDRFGSRKQILKVYQETDRNDFNAGFQDQYFFEDLPGFLRVSKYEGEDFSLEEKRKLEKLYLQIELSTQETVKGVVSAVRVVESQTKQKLVILKMSDQQEVLTYEPTYESIRPLIDAKVRLEIAVESKKNGKRDFLVVKDVWATETVSVVVQLIDKDALSQLVKVVLKHAGDNGVEVRYQNQHKKLSGKNGLALNLKSMKEFSALKEKMLWTVIETKTD
jgi:DNA polymerase-3 subunit alpha